MIEYKLNPDVNITIEFNTLDIISYSKGDAIRNFINGTDMPDNIKNIILSDAFIDKVDENVRNTIKLAITENDINRLTCGLGCSYRFNKDKHI